jgi:putative protease
MTQQFELLAPGGDIDSIKAAIVAGADAVYCGLDHFNARTRAANISFDNLNGLLKLAHKNDCQIFLTLNVIILEHEMPALIRLLNQLVNTTVDGVIVQDFGLFHILKEYYPTLDIHASTQVTTHNEGQINFLHKLNASRTNLSRELNIAEIKDLSNVSHNKNMLTEVFVHGSNCIGFSGLCYFSSAHGGNSGNRGRCSQPCRDKYQTTKAGKDYPLNLKDNSAFSDLEALADAGVDSLKVEGRIKKFHYVHTVISSWRKQIERYTAQQQLSHDKTDLHRVFNRGFANDYLTGAISRDMFIDNPRDNSVQHFTDVKGYSTEAEIQSVKQTLYDEKTVIINTVEEQIKDLSIEKTPLVIRISGELDNPLKMTVTTPDSEFNVLSASKLISSDKYTIDDSGIDKRLKSLNNAKFTIAELNLGGLNKGLFIPFKELTTIKNRIAFLLNGAKELIAPVELPALTKPTPLTGKAKLSILISAKKDINLCDSTTADIYYQLPDCIDNDYGKLVDLFLTNNHLIPWFPSIIIGDDYHAAVKFLQQVKPKRIVTNNTGIAYAAYANGIDWIAGPYLNITNSFSLLAMQQGFNCVGSFISNEINKQQMRRIVRPDNFELYYSIYHPLLLLTSRQCLFHQSVGCKKAVMDEKCLSNCKKSASIINLKETSFSIDKKRGEYNSMYNEHNFLNTDIITDLPDMFSGFFIDLRDIATSTQITLDKASIIQHFENLLDGASGSAEIICQNVQPTTHAQYSKGL